ncbi:MAG: methyltransferase domain-containing protein [Thermomicrobiales bacterium]
MPSHLDQIRDQQHEIWNRFSGGWKKWDGLILRWPAPFGDAMIRNAGLREDSRILDVAAGTGEPGLTAAAHAHRGSVMMTDLSERMLAVATENARRRGLGNIDTRICDADTLPFEDARFDAVLCRFGFMFFPDMSTAAREMARVAKPGARIVAAVWGAPEKIPGQPRSWTRSPATWTCPSCPLGRQGCSGARPGAACGACFPMRVCMISLSTRSRRRWSRIRPKAIGTS